MGVSRDEAEYKHRDLFSRQAAGMERDEPLPELLQPERPLSFVLSEKQTARIHLQDVSCRSVDACRAACLVPGVSGQHRTGIRLICGRSCGISDEWNRSGSCEHGWE